MKLSPLFFSAMLLTLIGMQSCNQDIELTGDFKETAVVYGLLDKSEDAHLIKITRAFIGPGNSLSIAQIPDSNYFNNVNATVVERVSGSVTRTWQLFDTIVPNKDTDGVFYAPEQKVYAFYSQSKDNSNNPTGQALLDNATYELNIIINEGTSDEFVVKGQTEIVNGISTTSDGSNYQFKFAQNSTTTGIYTNSGFVVNTGNSAVVNTKILIHYQDFIGSTDTIDNTISWGLGEKETSSATMNISAFGETFYNLVDESCQSGSAGVTKRNLTGLTVEVVAGSTDLYNYILVNQPSTSVAQNKPTYTNLTATNEHPVIGIFSSRFTHRVYHPMVSSTSQNVRCIDRTSTMELCIGPIAGSHLFCSQQTLDLAQNQPWACN